MDQNTNNRIMIVGGDSHFLYLMQRFVRSSAHQIVMANLGDDVLALARCKQPVAIVLEVDLPESSGWRTLRTLKDDLEVGKIPVIACSWLDEESRCLVEGASIYLRMPIMHTDFGAALAIILAKEKHE
jgi:CheY-like chemotaxis protein